MKRLDKEMNFIVNKVLTEEINKRVNSKVNQVQDKWYEIVSESQLNEKWNGDVEVKKTGEFAKMTEKEIEAEIKKLKDKTKKLKDSGKKVSQPDRKRMSQLYFALRSKKNWPGKGKVDVDEQETEEGNAFGKAVSDAKKSGNEKFNFDGKTYKVTSESTIVRLREGELIDLIEDIVMEEKSNITTKTPTGLSKTMDALKATGDENDEYAKEVVEKFKDYLKTSTKASYEPNPSHFPKNNYQIDKESKIMKYTPSDAVDEYIESFAYPGQTNLVFNEIKPEDEKIEKYLKGHKTTGNAEIDEDGNPLGNVVPSEVGKKFKKNYDENLYGLEQQTASYKRYPQDTIEVAGNSTKQGRLQKKTQSIFNQLESVDEKKSQKILNEVQKMKNIIGYKDKTQ